MCKVLTFPSNTKSQASDAEVRNNCKVVDLPSREARDIDKAQFLVEEAVKLIRAARGGNHRVAWLLEECADLLRAEEMPNEDLAQVSVS